MELDFIPTGSCRDDVYIRRDIIVKSLSPLIGKSFPLTKPPHEHHNVMNRHWQH